VQVKNSLVAKNAAHTFEHIWLLEGDSGRCEVESFLLELTDQDLAKFIAVFKRVDADPSFRHPERFQLMEHPVYEFKIFKYRVLCFKTGSDYVCVKGMKKRKSGHLRTTDDSIKAIKRIAREFEENGTYHAG
jgi:hypothetical protein